MTVDILFFVVEFTAFIHKKARSMNTAGYSIIRKLTVSLRRYDPNQVIEVISQLIKSTLNSLLSGLPFNGHPLLITEAYSSKNPLD